MSQNKQAIHRNLLDYVPAQVAIGKIIRVWYYAKDPLSGELCRVVVKCNRLKGRRENTRQAQILAESINVKLREGWNPFVESLRGTGGIDVVAAVDMFLEEKCQELRPDSMRCYRSYCAILKGWVKEHHDGSFLVQTFTESHADKLIEHVGGSVSNRTYNGYVRFFRTLFNWCMEQHYCSANPFEHVKMKREEKKHRTTIPPELRGAIRDYLVEHGQTGFLQVCLMCYRMFIRPKEIMMLRVGMVDRCGWTVTIPSDVAKNHNERIVAIPENMRGWFDCMKGCDPDMFVFSAGYRPGNVMLTSRDVGRSWQRLRKELGFSDKYTFYSLKDTGITEMLERGVPAKLVKELADHHSLEMTERYLHKSKAQEILRYDVLEF